MAVTLGRTLLKQFLEARKAVLTQAAAAQQIGISPGQLVYYLQGTQRPKQAVAERIEKWSGGAVPADSWLTADEKAKLASVERAPEPAPRTGKPVVAPPLPPKHDEVTPAAAPEPKRLSSSRPPPPSELVDAVDLTSEGTPTDVNVEPLPERTPSPPLPGVKVSERNVRTDTNPETVDAKELPPLHGEAHPELGAQVVEYTPEELADRADRNTPVEP